MLFLYFNSRPHEEIDDWLLNTVTNLDISTHDLTRRSTAISAGVILSLVISTHDLTRRSTGFYMNLMDGVDISTHDLTRRSTILEEKEKRV